MKIPARNFIPTWYNLIMLVLLIMNCNTSSWQRDRVDGLDKSFTTYGKKYAEVESDYIKCLRRESVYISVILTQQKMIWLLGHKKLTISQVLEYDTLNRQETVLLDSIKHLSK